MSDKQITLGLRRIAADNDPRYNWEVLSSILEAMGYPAAATSPTSAKAGISFSPGAAVDFQLGEVLKDTDGDGVFTAIATVLDTDGTATTTEPTTVVVCDRGGRWTNARVNDQGVAHQRLINGEVCWDISEIRESRQLYLYSATDSTGGTTLNDTAAKITFDSEVYNQGNIWTLSASTLNVNTDGALLIEADVTIDCTSLTSGNPSVAIYVDVNGTEQTGSRRFFHPISVTGKSSITCSWVHSLTNGDAVSIKGIVTNHGSVTATVSTVADGSVIRASILDVDINNTINPDAKLGNVFEWESTTTTNNTKIANVGSYAIAAPTGSGHPSNGGSNCGNLTTSTLGSYTTNPSSWSWSLDDMTVLFWFKPGQAANADTIFYKSMKNFLHIPEWRCYLSGTRSMTLEVSVFSSNDVILGQDTIVETTTGSLTNGTWYMVALLWEKFTATGDRWRIGISINGGTIDWSSALDVTGNLFLGTEAYQNGGIFRINDDYSGDKADFQVDLYRQWFRLLSTSELTYHYNGGAGRSWPF